MVDFGSVVLPVADVHRSARFWSGALGYVLRDGAIGDSSPTLVPADGNGPPIVLDAEDRMHLDLHVAGKAEQRAEVDRLVELGARQVPWTYPDDADFVVLADTEGNLFCVVDTDAGTAELE